MTKKKEQKPIMLVFPLIDGNIPKPKTISEDNVLNSLVSADELFVSEEEISSSSSGHSSPSLTKKKIKKKKKTSQKEGLESKYRKGRTDVKLKPSLAPRH